MPTVPRVLFLCAIKLIKCEGNFIPLWDGQGNGKARKIEPSPPFAGNAGADTIYTITARSAHADDVHDDDGDDDDDDDGN